MQATMRTNLDPPSDSPYIAKRFTVDFPAMPTVGQGFLWGTTRTKICSVGWECEPANNCRGDCKMMLVVEFNH